MEDKKLMVGKPFKHFLFGEGVIDEINEEEKRFVVFYKNKNIRRTSRFWQVEWNEELKISEICEQWM